MIGTCNFLNFFFRKWVYFFLKRDSFCLKSKNNISFSRLRYCRSSSGNCTVFLFVFIENPKRYTNVGGIKHILGKITNGFYQIIFYEFLRISYSVPPPLKAPFAKIKPATCFQKVWLPYSESTHNWRYWLVVHHNLSIGHRPPIHRLLANLLVKGGFAIIKSAFKSGCWSLPKVSAGTSPKLAWQSSNRQIHFRQFIGGSRIFLSVDRNFLFITVMAFYKFNRLHKHPTTSTSWVIDNTL